MAASPVIQAFRVYVSGRAQTFDDVDDAVAFLRAEAVHNRIGQISFETAHLSKRDYRLEVRRQEARLTP